MSVSPLRILLPVPLALACSTEQRFDVHFPAEPIPASAAVVTIGDEPAAPLDAALSLRDCPQPAELGVHLVGRFDGCDPSGVRMGWSGTGFVARFSGSGIRLRQSGPAVQYTVLVDGRQVSDLTTTPGTASYALATGLAVGEHVVEAYRRGEASFGAVVIQGFEVVDGRLLPAPQARPHRIEVVGDSISCGYGNEGTSTECHFSADTENHYLAYGSVLGRMFDAEVSTIAWSGKGVVVNYSGEPGPRLPELYESAVPTDAPSRWGFAWRPEVVVLNLGTNDYSTDVDPADDAFVRQYQALLEVIRNHYPEAFILCTIGPMLSGPDLEAARATIRAAVEHRSQAGDGRVVVHELRVENERPGCDWHPSVAVHAAIGRELGAVISQALGWEAQPEH